MKKKMIALMGATVLTFTMGTTAFANNAVEASDNLTMPVIPQNSAYSCFGGGATGMMMDDNGNLLSQEAFEARLDSAVQDGQMTQEEKAYYLNMYERCTTGRNMGSRSRGCC